MKKSNQGRLESILKQHVISHETEHHPHPHEFIASHVVLILFISLMFLASIFMFLVSDPTDNHATAYALVDFTEVDLDFGVGEKIGSAFSDVVDNTNRSEFLMMMYICWILVLGALNLYFVEKEHK